MKTGTNLLQKFNNIIHDDLERISNNPRQSEVQEELLAMHRALLVLLNSHMERMGECGIEDIAIVNNIKAVDHAAQLLAEDTDNIDTLCTMPPAEA